MQLGEVDDHGDGAMFVEQGAKMFFFFHDELFIVAKVLGTISSMEIYKNNVAIKGDM